VLGLWKGLTGVCILEVSVVFRYRQPAVMQNERFGYFVGGQLFLWNETSSFAERKIWIFRGRQALLRNKRFGSFVGGKLFCGTKDLDLSWAASCFCGTKDLDLSLPAASCFCGTKDLDLWLPAASYFCGTKDLDLSLAAASCFCGTKALDLSLPAASCFCGMKPEIVRCRRLAGFVELNN